MIGRGLAVREKRRQNHFMDFDGIDVMVLYPTAGRGWYAPTPARTQAALAQIGADELAEADTSRGEVLVSAADHLEIPPQIEIGHPRGAEVARGDLALHGM